MSKSKRRREARRRARDRREEGRAEAPQPGAGAEEAAAPPVEARQPRPARKKTRRGSRRVRVSPWLVAAPLAAAGIAVLAFLVISSGSSGGSGGDGGSAAPTPDPRVAGLTPTASYTIQAGGESDDAYFQPDTVTAAAGDVIELVVENIGTVTHNLRVSGPNGEYDVDTGGNKGDDFEMPPNVVKPGETGTLVVKIDEPGTYPFRCDFHPLVQTGTLVLE